MRLTLNQDVTPSLRFARPMGRLVGWLVVLLFATYSHAQTHPYRTSQAIELQSSLMRVWEQPITRQPIMDLIQEWSSAYSIPIWLDRHVPTDVLVTVDVRPLDVETIIRNVAESIGAEMAVIDRLVVIVPKGKATCLERAYWNLTQSPIATPWLRVEKSPLQWEEGSESRAVVASFLKRYPVEGCSVEALEHDIWRGAKWEQVTPAAIAVCLLSEFDLQPLAVGKSVQVGPGCGQDASLPLFVSWDYRDEITKLGKEKWQAWKEEWPDAEIQRVGTGNEVRWRITTSVAAHRALVAPLAPPPKPLPASELEKARFSGRYRGEFRVILQSVAVQMKLDMEVPELSQQVLRQELDLTFDNASLDEILASISKASGVGLVRKGKRIEFTQP